jgi:hypothetical protein
MGSISDKVCRENQNKYLMFSNFSPDDPDFYAIMWGKKI